MATKPLICPNCGGRIQTFDETTSKGFCPYCDSVILNVPELQQQCAQDAEKHEQFNRIVTFVKLGEHARALQLAKEYADKYPSDPRAWKMLCDLELDSAIALDGDSFDRTGARSRVKTYASHLAALASSDEDEEYLNTIAQKLGKEKERLEGAARELSQKRTVASNVVEQSEKQLDLARSETDPVFRASVKTINVDAGSSATKAAFAVGFLWLVVFASFGFEVCFGGAIIAVIASAVIVNAIASARKKEAREARLKASEKLEALGNAHREASNNLNAIQRALEGNTEALAYVNDLLSIVGNH